PENISALASAGCDEVWIGAESGSQKILNLMDKGITVEQIYKATDLLKKNKIKPCFFLQLGYKGELKSDIDSTLKMLFDLMPHDIGISVSYPLPGTKFYESVKESMQEKTNWTDSDDLAMMFPNQYPPDFYRKLQKYIHKKFRQKQTEVIFENFMIKNLFSTDFFKKLIRYPFYFFSTMPPVQ
ncbi:MAG: B12-binding domain-containing radical SAM protein, partial [Bacteroidia bacterium]